MRRLAMQVTIAAVFLAAVPAAGALAKDVEPALPRCDALAKGSAEWHACVGTDRPADTTGTAAAGPSDDELFYAGYWLARAGAYADALTLLERTESRSTRVLTYMGFAKRKLGRLDEAFADYHAALARDAGNVVARSYLGEAHLARGDMVRAEAELAEIARRCGTACAEYAELASHIAHHRSARGGNG
ncbi:MAG: hypothetical protein NW217_14750 [Hyphomicrobiaceae bacterium]|nr:hypothetical protein [Hyphomicrobiaceae bacterium]